MFQLSHESDITSALSYRLNHLVWTFMLSRLSPAADPTLSWCLHMISMRAVARIAHDLRAVYVAARRFTNVACSFIGRYVIAQRNKMLSVSVRIFVSIMVNALRCQINAYMILRLSVYISRNLSIYPYARQFSQQQDIRPVRAFDATVQYGAKVKVRPLKRTAIIKSKILSFLIIVHTVSSIRGTGQALIFKTELRTSRTSAKRLLDTGFQPTKWPPSNSGAPATRPAGPGLPSGGDAADYD